MAQAFVSYASKDAIFADLAKMKWVRLFWDGTQLLKIQ
jgi:hypothetical protein